MKYRPRRNYIMAFIFWGFIVLFAILVYPQLLFAFINSNPSAEANPYIKPSVVACLAIVLYVLGVSFTAVLSSTVLYFTIPIIYRKWRRLSITRYFIAVRTPRTKTNTSEQKARRRTSSPREKDVKVLFSTSQKKAEFNKRHDANMSDSSASGIMEAKGALLDKGQQTSQGIVVANEKTPPKEKKTSEKMPEERKKLEEKKMEEKKKMKEKKMEEKKKEEKNMEEKKMADVGVQAMRPDSLDPRIEGRINILESRLRLEELRNRAWCARMTETEECLNQMRIQMRKMQGIQTRRVVDQATNTSTEKFSTKEPRFQTSKTMETPTVRDKGDHKAVTTVEESYFTQLHPNETNVYIREQKTYPKEQKSYPKEQKVYPKEHKLHPKEQKAYAKEINMCHSELLVNPSEPKVTITELKETSTELYVPKGFPAELKGYPTEQEVFPSELNCYPTEGEVFPSELNCYPIERKVYTTEVKMNHTEPTVNPKELQLTKRNEAEMALIKVDHDYLALTKVNPADLALLKVDPADLALTKVDPAAQQVKPWKASQPFPAPLPDDAIYSEDFNILLRRLRAEAGEPTWTRVQSERSHNSEQPSSESSRTIDCASKF